MPDQDDQSALAALRALLAGDFARLDAEQYGYDHGFSADPDQDEETSAFVAAAITTVMEAAADLVAPNGSDDCRCGGCDSCAQYAAAQRLRGIAQLAQEATSHG